MSTCNCDGTISQSAWEFIVGDDLISNVDISTANGGFDPRPISCQQAVDSLRAQAQDPCNLDSPEDLQVLYQAAIPGVVKVGQGTPASNAIQRAVDIRLGTATPETVITGNRPPATKPTNWTFVIGAIVILTIGFFLVFR